MFIRVSLVLATALLVVLTGLPADAQDTKPKGVSATNLVTSLGGFRETVSSPIVLTGSLVTLEPGGQTGREQFRVPTYIFVVDGILTTDYEAGPVGIKGAQYHAGGQSFVDQGSWWHNHMNRTDKPVKYLRLHITYPGAPNPVQQADAE
jgi:hypothetical protein